MEVGVERLTAIAFLITGLSHLFAHKAWARFFMRVRSLGEAAGFVNAWIHAPLGLIIVAFHPVWSGPGLLITLVGWSLTVKGALYFCAPRLAQRTLAGVSEERAWAFRVAGGLALILAAFAAWLAR